MIRRIECTSEKHLKSQSILSDPEMDMNRRYFVEMILFVNKTWDLVASNQL